jgi:hypothetical protein
VDYLIEWMGLEKQAGNRNFHGILLGVLKRLSLNTTKLIFVHGQSQDSIFGNQLVVRCFQNCDQCDLVFPELRLFRRFY